MESTRSNRPRQADPSKVRAAALPYAQIPLCLLTLPTGERAAAQEVWAALHCHLKLGTSAQRITDEELSTVPWLVERSVEHARKGLEILERLGLIIRDAKGSSRRVGIVAGLKRACQAAEPRSIPVAPNGHGKTPPVPGLSKSHSTPLPEGWATDFWGRVYTGKVVPTN